MYKLKLVPCFLTILITFSSYVLSYSNDIDYDGWLNIRLEHSLSNSNEGEFSARGNVSIHGGTSLATNLPLSTGDKQKLQQLAKEDQFYRLKATVVYSDGTETSFLTSVKACILAQSGLHDFISISMDHSNNVVGVSLGVQTSIACQGADVSVDDLNKFNTRVYVMPITMGPMPDTASYIQKLEREREAKERGDVKDNRSFLAKYWMYIVPVVIIMVVSSAANPDGAAGAGGRVQGQ